MAKKLPNRVRHKTDARRVDSSSISFADNAGDAARETMLPEPRRPKVPIDAQVEGTPTPRVLLDTRFSLVGARR
jgi:hypothetical protein